MRHICPLDCLFKQWRKLGLALAHYRLVNHWHMCRMKKTSRRPVIIVVIDQIKTPSTLVKWYLYNKARKSGVWARTHVCTLSVPKCTHTNMHIQICTNKYTKTFIVQKHIPTHAQRLRHTHTDTHNVCSAAQGNRSSLRWAGPDAMGLTLPFIWDSSRWNTQGLAAQPSFNLICITASLGANRFVFLRVLFFCNRENQASLKQWQMWGKAMANPNRLQWQAVSYGIQSIEIH